MSVSHRVFNTVAEWLKSGEQVWLCTIVETWGASPRPAGSVMAFHPKYGIIGSLSGGCIEENLVRRFSISSSESQINRKPVIHEYAITSGDQEKYTLPCGGQLSLLIEHLKPEPATIDHISTILNAFEGRCRIRRRVSLLDATLSFEESALGADVELSEVAVSVVFGPDFNMLLLGAGEVSRYVAQLAMTVDFKVTLCDPRERFLQGWQLGGVEVLQCLPDDLIRERFSDDHSAIIALAHDPRVDDMGLMEALKTEAFYVGAMGSERTTENRRSRLLQLDLQQCEINKLHGPIGFDIGSKKPPEIAISIMAQVLEKRHQFIRSKQSCR